MKPYYQDDFVTLYQGDCREVVPQLGLSVDLLLTDPPYESQAHNAQRQTKAYLEGWIPQKMNVYPTPTQNEDKLKTSEKLASQYGVSRATIERDGQ